MLSTTFGAGILAAAATTEAATVIATATAAKM